MARCAGPSWPLGQSIGDASPISLPPLPPLPSQGGGGFNCSISNHVLGWAFNPNAGTGLGESHRDGRSSVAATHLIQHHLVKHGASKSQRPFRRSLCFGTLGHLLKWPSEPSISQRRTQRPCARSRAWRTSIPPVWPCWRACKGTSGWASEGTHHHR